MQSEKVKDFTDKNLNDFDVTWGKVELDKINITFFLNQ